MFRPAYPLSAVSQVDVMTSKAASPEHASPLPSGPPLCEDGRPYVTDPVTGRKICMCNLGAEAAYGSRGLLTDARKHGALPGHAGGSAIGFDTSAFYSPLIRGLPVRQERLPPYLTSGMPGQPMAFDPSMAAHPYGLLYAGLDVNGGPMRKAATRETTGPLKVWLSEHKKNPYPTKAEKIMLAIITRMTLTQVSTWFANARRRLKKENKLFPADGEGRDDDDDDDDLNDSHRGGSASHASDSARQLMSDSDNEDINVDLSDCSDIDDDVTMQTNDVSQLGVGAIYKTKDSLSEDGPSPDHRVGNDNQSGSTQHQNHKKHSDSGRSGSGTKDAHTSTSSSNKPKIWSISEIINEPSSSEHANQRRSSREDYSSSHTSTPLALSKLPFPSSSTPLSKHTPPLSTNLMTSPTLSSSPFSASTSSSSSSPLSPPAFRPLPPHLMGGPPLFTHRPEFSGFVRRYGYPMPMNGVFLERSAATALSSHVKLEDMRMNSNSTNSILMCNPFSHSKDSGRTETNGQISGNNSRESPNKSDTSPTDHTFKPTPATSQIGSNSSKQDLPKLSSQEAIGNSSCETSSASKSKSSSPYKPKTQNAILNGTFEHEEALDLQTKKRAIDT